MFQQKWKAKRLVRAYHGDWIEEKRFKKFFLPDSLPPIVGKKNLEGVSKDAKVPLTSMMFAEVEKRLDTVVFRCCFADSVYKARQMVVHGKVKLNGKKVRFGRAALEGRRTGRLTLFLAQQHSDPHTRLQPGDLISVDPDAVSTLQPPKPHEAASNLSKVSTGGAETSDDSTPTSSDQSDSASSSPKPPRTRPLPFHLPEYAAPFLFVPHYIEPSFSTCSAIYLRHPTASPGHSEVPSPYQADGEVMKLAWVSSFSLSCKVDSSRIFG